MWLLLLMLSMQSILIYLWLLLLAVLNPLEPYHNWLIQVLAFMLVTVTIILGLYGVGMKTH